MPDVATVDVVQVAAVGGNAGWCTVSWGLDSPEIEIFCGGLNTKGPNYAGLWRQGNLLHFGFEPSPQRLNETGRALLVNSIEYISRFTEDRPLARFAAPLSDARPKATRRFIQRTLGLPSATAASLSTQLEDSLKAKLTAMSDEEAIRWVRENLDFMRCDGSKLIVDEDLKALGIKVDAPDFERRLRDALKRDPKRALRVAQRAIPQGPGSSAGAADWAEWLADNGRFLFFSEGDEFRWHIDPLAQERDIASAECRGSLRADLD